MKGGKMDFINRIGQRKFAKILFALSIVISLICYVSRSLTDQEHEFNNLLIKSILGIILLSTPIGILTLTAHKTREFRLFCIFSSITIILLNTVMFFLKVNLLYITFIEIIVSLIFYMYVGKHEKDRKTHEKKLKNSKATNITKTVEQETKE